MSAPWQKVASAAVLWGLLGPTGIVYEIVVTRRMRMQTVYTPQFEDWLFHVLLPFGAYAALAGSAFALIPMHTGPCFGVGAAALLLLFIGIHNTWDAVTYHVFFRKRGQHEGEH